MVTGGSEGPKLRSRPTRSGETKLGQPLQVVSTISGCRGLPFCPHTRSRAPGVAETVCSSHGGPVAPAGPYRECLKQRRWEDIQGRPPGVA